MGFEDFAVAGEQRGEAALAAMGIELVDGPGATEGADGVGGLEGA